MLTAQVRGDGELGVNRLTPGFVVVEGREAQIFFHILSLSLPFINLARGLVLQFITSLVGRTKAKKETLEVQP